MTSDRLRTVEEFLKILWEQHEQLERDILLNTGRPSIQAQQTLVLEIKPKIREYEKEYWQILAEQSGIAAITEPEAEVIVAEIVEQTEKLQTSQQYPDEVLDYLKKIYAEVSKPGTPAAAKLKGALSLLPPFVSLAYEAEIDTESFVRTHFPTFSRWTKALAKKS
ncbi:hypothetical protein [Geitlerinema sp. PCC 7407]|uniref:hypothetical protein n=1 Tax=Geitlerinema sp. PCC 7407 TaxID=1173025 RepID=UPI00029FF1E5|nr:hypothetical protein [Geitlerinema sp. PCC 7407]AFY64981.1 hypothetical protein GEI7407_0480 [Geitlerinema sp. PCC 7407]